MYVAISAISRSVSGRNTLHFLVKAFSVDGELAFFTVADQTDYFFIMIGQIVRSIDRRKKTSQAFAVFLVTVAAMRKKKLFTFNIVLRELSVVVFFAAGGAVGVESVLLSFTLTAGKQKNCDQRTPE